MEKIKAELEEFIATGYDFDALMDIGNGWESYEGCTRNLLMILEDQDTTIQIVDESSEYYVVGIKRYHITLPAWWRKGMIAVSFEESELV